MANKRELKRGISYICGELFAECIATSAYSNNADNENKDTMLRTIIRVHDDYVRRVSHPEPGMTAKKYYQILIGSFSADVNDMVDQIRNLYN